MELKQYLAEIKKREPIQDWCKRNGLNPISVSLVSNGHRKAGPELAKKLSIASGGVVPLAAIRPDLWGVAA